MQNWYYYDMNGAKCGPFSAQQIKELVAWGTIVRNTPLQPDQGNIAMACQYSGLFDQNPAQPQYSSTPAGRSPEYPSPLPQGSHTIDTNTGTAGPTVNMNVIMATGSMVLLSFIGIFCYSHGLLMYHTLIVFCLFTGSYIRTHYWGAFD